MKISNVILILVFMILMTACNNREVQRPAITKHLNNIFESDELDEKVVCSILELTTQPNDVAL